MAPGHDLCFEVMYVEMGSDARSGLVRPLGTRLDDMGDVLTDAHQRSSTDGLFAAGDVVRSLDQISVAIGEAPSPRPRSMVGEGGSLGQDAGRAGRQRGVLPGNGSRLGEMMKRCPRSATRSEVGRYTSGPGE